MSKPRNISRWIFLSICGKLCLSRDFAFYLSEGRCRNSEKHIKETACWSWCRPFTVRSWNRKNISRNNQGRGGVENSCVSGINLWLQVMRSHKSLLVKHQLLLKSFRGQCYHTGTSSLSRQTFLFTAGLESQGCSLRNKPAVSRPARPAGTVCKCSRQGPREKQTSEYVALTFL